VLTEAVCPKRKNRNKTITDIQNICDLCLLIFLAYIESIFKRSFCARANLPGVEDSEKVLQGRVRLLEVFPYCLLEMPCAQKVPYLLTAFFQASPHLSDSSLFCRAIVSKKPPVAPSLLPPCPLS
jgi:hypothetical protein